MRTVTHLLQNIIESHLIKDMIIVHTNTINPNVIVVVIMDDYALMINYYLRSDIQ